MRIVGRDAADRVVFTTTLPHGENPDVTVYDQGYVMEGTRCAQRAADGELELELSVRPRSGEAAPRRSVAGRDRELVVGVGEQPQQRQRIAAYALVRSSRGLLATQYSDRTAVDGRWGMPGGGLDDGEEPAAAALREVHEETGQLVILGDLVTVQTSHWIGRSPRGILEDFHAVRLVYAATCPQPSDPQVLDAGGTTADARWVALAEWTRLDWTPGWRAILTAALRP